MRLEIAIDGPAASGKSTAARNIAARIGGFYINTGDMYRTIAWLAREEGIDPQKNPEKVVALLKNIDLRYGLDDENKPELLLNNESVPQAAIRDPQVAAVVSFVAKIPEVREWLLPRQRSARELGTIVMEGRDIGTVILPDADFKFFITASPHVRALRRLQQEGEAPAESVEAVAAKIAERDQIDSNRKVAPLKTAPDAIVIETDGMSAEEVADLLMSVIEKEGKKVD